MTELELCVDDNGVLWGTSSELIFGCCDSVAKLEISYTTETDIYLNNVSQSLPLNNYIALINYCSSYETNSIIQPYNPYLIANLAN